MWIFNHTALLQAVPVIIMTEETVAVGQRGSKSPGAGKAGTLLMGFCERIPIHNHTFDAP